MNTNFKPHLKPLTVVLVAWGIGIGACTNTSTQLLEQQIAHIKKTRVQEVDYLKGLATAVKEEKRNEAWAAQKESEVRKSYDADKSVPRGALKSVECRTSKCDLQLQPSGEQSLKGTIEQQIAINQWIGASQPCGYTMTTDPGSGQVPGAVRIFLHCSR
jgi:hypothetical protein